MSNKEDSLKHDDEYHMLAPKEPKKVGHGNQLDYSKKIKEECEEKSPILAENTIKNEETLKKLWIVSAICLIFMIIEIIGGYLANSIAIMSDAAHLLSDFLGFIISIVSIYISRRGATHQMSFGYHRAEVIGALASITLIWGLTLWLLYEAFLRIVHSSEVDGLVMLITAVIGFVFNIVMGVILAYQGIDHKLHFHHDGEGGHDHAGHSHGHDHGTIKRSYTYASKKSRDHHPNSRTSKELKHLKTSLGVIGENKEYSAKEEKECKDRTSHDHDHPHDEIHKHKHSRDGASDKSFITHVHNDGGHSHENINIKAALIHVIGDAVQNLGVVIAGVVIYFWPSLSIADPICTYIFSIIVVFTTIRLLKDCVAILMEGSPLEVDMETLEKDLLSIKGVVEIHDLHVWSLSLGKLSLSCHLTSINPQITLKKARKMIRMKYKITHSTIQVELDSDKATHDCAHDLHNDWKRNSIEKKIE